METFDVTMFGPDGNPIPLAAGCSWCNAYCIAYGRAYREALPGVEVAIVHADTGKRQFTFGPRVVA